MTLDHLDTIISFVAIITGVSLLVTTLTQAISALLGLRGTNLRWGIEMLLKHGDPQLADHAKEISEKVLHHSLVSDSAFSGLKFFGTGRWRLATGIRQDELIDVLQALAEPTATPAVATPKAGSSAPAPWQDALRASLDVLDSGEVNHVLQLAPAIRKALPDDADTAEEIITRLSTTAESLTVKINQWFDSVMDRVSQRFALHTRVVTVIFSAVLAFGLHLDTFRMFTQLSTDSDLRSRVLASADALTQKANEAIAASGGVPPSAYIDEMTHLIAAHPELKALPAPVGFKDDAGARDWLQRELEKAKIPDADQWLARYEELVPQSALHSAAAQLNTALNNKFIFQLVPNPYPAVETYWTPNLMHFWGTLASAALLSLGAPFWFNMLKDLSNLRPVLAKKQEEEADDGTASG
jgi:hypothetical protein